MKLFTKTTALPFAALALVLASSACSSGDDSSDSTTTASATTASATTTSTASGSGGGGGGSASTTTSTSGSADASSSTGAMQPLVLTSPEFANGAEMPKDASCEGAGKSPALTWSGTPPDTAEFALLVTTLAKDGLKYNWVLHGIPAGTSSLVNGATGIGIAGLTSNGPNLAYAPPCSPGPGTKIYTFTLYALSGKPTLPSDPKQVTGAVLEQAVAPLTLAKASLDGAHTTMP